MKDLKNSLQQISALPATKSELQFALSAIDLTSLNGFDNQSSISLLCDNALKYGTAAVCIYPTFVAQAKKHLSKSEIKVVSVAGAFPHSQLPLSLRLEEIKYALDEGADEIDMVISRGKLLEGDTAAVYEEISSAKKICSNKTLKVILETGELINSTNIQLAGKIAVDAGADFLKTSTGKTNVNATPESVYDLLTVIKNSNKKIGIKW